MGVDMKFATILVCFCFIVLQCYFTSSKLFLVNIDDSHNIVTTARQEMEVKKESFNSLNEKMKFLWKQKKRLKDNIYQEGYDESNIEYGNDYKEQSNSLHSKGSFNNMEDCMNFVWMPTKANRKSIQSQCKGILELDKKINKKKPEKKIKERKTIKTTI